MLMWNDVIKEEGTTLKTNIFNDTATQKDNELSKGYQIIITKLDGDFKFVKKYDCSYKKYMLQ